ncbi:hypothetical protein ACCO45_009155 [Purpureocillium lilacinum]|uniref:Uncharacterized protein n=1 Tax=Purpureocillium lilacinum TaxID=33203 RepID=A0ACC4DL99_PURLI
MMTVKSGAWTLVASRRDPQRAQTQPRQHRGGQKTWKRSRHSSGPSGTSHSRVCGGRGIQCLDFALGGREAATEATQTLSANARRRSGKHPSERNPYVSQASACQGQAVDSPGCFFAAAAATEAEAAVAAAPAAPAPAATPLFPKAPPPFFGSRVRGARAVHPRTARAISCPPAGRPLIFGPLIGLWPGLAFLSRRPLFPLSSHPVWGDAAGQLRFSVRPSGAMTKRRRRGRRQAGVVPSSAVLMAMASVRARVPMQGMRQSADSEQTRCHECARPASRRHDGELEQGQCPMGGDA